MEEQKLRLYHNLEEGGKVFVDENMYLYSRKSPQSPFELLKTAKPKTWIQKLLSHLGFTK